MVLMLLTPEEKKTLKSDILIEPVIFEYYDDVLSRLYNPDYESIIMTRRYIETAGEEKVFNAFKAIYAMSLHFVSSIYLLDHRDNIIDQYTAMYAEIGIRVLSKDIIGITYEEYTRLYALDPVQVDTIPTESVNNEVSSLVAEIKQINSNDISSYVEANYSRITSTILRCEQALLHYKETNDRVVELTGQLDQVKSTLQHYKDRLAYEKYVSCELEHVNQNARQIILRYASSIQEYNATILRTNVNEEYVYCNHERRTVILYFKELEDIGFFKLFNVLYDTLKDTYCLRVKALVLENNVRRYYNPYTGYKVLNNVPKTNEVVMNDKLVRYGNARKVIEVMTRPQMQLDFLLVYDRTYTPEICTQFKEQYVFFLGRNRENYNGLGYHIPDTSFISPYEGDYTDISFLYRDTDALSEISLKMYCNRCYFFKEIAQLCVTLSKRM